MCNTDDFPIQALNEAEDKKTYNANGKIIYSISDSGEFAFVSAFEGDGGEVVIAQNFEGLPVKEIKDRVLHL